MYRLTSLVTTPPYVPGTLDIFEVLSQAEATRKATISSSAFRNKISLSLIAEYAMGVTVTSGLLRPSNGCVIFPTLANFPGFTTATTGTSQNRMVAGESAQETAEMGGVCTPGIEELPRATIEPPVIITYAR